MEEKRYIISEAAEKIGIESHVLRYWEEELGLAVPRNEMGHRYYTDSHLKLFQQIKEMKESGFQLKAVKTVLDNADSEVDASLGKEEDKVFMEKETEVIKKVPAADNEMEITKSEDKLAQFEQIISDIVSRTLMANNSRLGEDISYRVTDKVSDKVIKEMDYLLRVKEEAEDDRFKKLDETIRGLQKSNKEAAAYKETQIKKRKKGLFHK